MDLSLNDTQKLIQDSAKDFVRGSCTRDVLLKIDRDPAVIMSGIWTQMVDMGWTGMAIPEAYGGTGNNLTDVAVLFEELGAGPVPGPLFSSAVLCARMIMEAANDEQKKTWLPKIASGERVFALALTEQQYNWSANGIRSYAKRDAGNNGGYTLSGTKVFVHDALHASDLLVAARVDGAAQISLVRVDAKAAGVAVRGLDGFITGLAEVVLDNVKVAASDVMANAWPAAERAMLAVTPVLCAYKVGACKFVYELSLNYARERTQFGQIIGRFTRVQDHIIHLVNYLDSARWTTYEALAKLDGGADAAANCHVAKSVASESYMRACDYAHEVHAGIGVSREYGLTLHTKMSRTLYHCLGAPKLHRKKLESVLGLVAA